MSPREQEKALIERIWTGTLRPAVASGSMTHGSASQALAAALRLRRRGQARADFWMNDDALEESVRQLVEWQKAGGPIRSVFRFLESVAPKAVLRVAGERAAREKREHDRDARLASANLSRLGILIDVGRGRST